MRTRIIEGFKDEKTPDLKYYAFDWDDNIVHMPTKIIVKDEDGDEFRLNQFKKTNRSFNHLLIQKIRNKKENDFLEKISP